MSFESFEDAPSEVSESIDVNETWDVHGEEGFRDSEPDLEYDLDDDSWETDEVNEAGEDSIEGDDGEDLDLEYDLDDNSWETDETHEYVFEGEEGDEFNLDYDLDDDTWDTDEVDEDEEDPDEFVLPGSEPRQTGIEIQEDDAPEAAPDGGDSPDDVSKTEVSSYAHDEGEAKDTEITGSSDSPKSSSGYHFTPEQKAFRDSLDPSNYSQNGSGEGDKPTSSDANDDEHAEPPERDISDEIPKAPNPDSEPKPEKEKAKRNDFLESLKFDVGQSPTIPETQNKRPPVQNNGPDLDL